MKRHAFKNLTLITIISSTLILHGCGSFKDFSSNEPSSNHQRSHYSQPEFIPPPVTKKLADTPPPPPRIDNITPSPGTGYVWMDGYWNWSDGKYVWSNGRWTPERPGQFWVAPQWKQVGSGWRLQPGYWKTKGKK